MYKVKSIRFKRGNKATNDEWIGLHGSISLDYGTQTVRIHDGVTPGGLFHIGRSELAGGSSPEFKDKVDVFYYDAMSPSNVFSTVNVSLEDPTSVRVLVDGELTNQWSIVNDAVVVNENLSNGTVIEIYSVRSIDDIVEKVFIETGTINTVIRSQLEESMAEVTGTADFDISQIITTTDIVDLGTVNPNLEGTFGYIGTTESTFTIDDLVVDTASTWSSQKIDLALSNLSSTLTSDIATAISTATGSVDDTVTTLTTTWSSSKIETELAALQLAAGSGATIDDANVSSTKVWSSAKTSAEIVSTVDTVIQSSTVASINDVNSSLTDTWSSSRILDEIALEINTVNNTILSGDSALETRISALEAANNASTGLDVDGRPLNASITSLMVSGVI